jgi:hypothetical protein
LHDVFGVVDILRLIWDTLADFFRLRAYLQTEIIASRHQLNVWRRKRPERQVFGNTKRFLFVWLYRLASGTLSTLSIIKPQTVISRHRRGFRALCRWKSRSRRAAEGTFGNPAPDPGDERCQLIVGRASHLR